MYKQYIKRLATLRNRIADSRNNGQRLSLARQYNDLLNKMPLDIKEYWGSL